MITTCSTGLSRLFAGLTDGNPRLAIHTQLGPPNVPAAAHDQCLVRAKLNRSYYVDFNELAKSAAVLLAGIFFLMSTSR